jgi:hypothetical protein
MIHARNAEVMKDIHGLKLLRNNAEVWRWHKQERLKAIEREAVKIEDARGSL